MNRRAVALLFCLSTCFVTVLPSIVRAATDVWGSGASSATGCSGTVYNVGVADLQAIEVAAGEAVTVADWLRGYMMKTGGFKVVEKERMDAIMGEQVRQQTGCTDQTCAVKLGRLLNVQRMVVGSCTKAFGKYQVSVRMVNVEDSQLVAVEKASAVDPDTLEAEIEGLAYRLCGGRAAAKPSAQPLAPTAQLYSGRAINMAVVDLQAEGVSTGDTAVVTNLLRSALVKYGSLNVVEKRNMDLILSEQVFQAPGCASPECAVKLGKLLNVRCMVVGSFGKLLSSYFLSVRVLDVETGYVIVTESDKVQTVDDIERSIGSMAGRIANQATGWYAQKH